MKMRLFLCATLALSAWMCDLSAQKYPQGVYMSFEEVCSRKPSGGWDMVVSSRTQREIKMQGGNDYKVEPLNSKSMDKSVRSNIYGYSSGDTLFINCKLLKLQNHYAAVIDDGRYLVFRAALSQDRSTQKRQLEMAGVQSDDAGLMLGALGGAIAGAEIALIRVCYAIDKSTGEVIPMDGLSVAKMLAGYPDLAKQFDRERRRDSGETQLRYVKLYNKRYVRDSMRDTLAE